MGAILIDRWVILWSGREREKKKSLIIYRLHQVGLNGRRRCCSGCCIVSAVANDGGINDSYTNERAHSTWRRPLRTRPVLEPATASESRTDSQVSLYTLSFFFFFILLFTSAAAASLFHMEEETRGSVVDWLSRLVESNRKPIMPNAGRQ